MRLLLWLLLGLTSAATARADRDIVYAARYYAPPGSHRTSHFHLYRINPDGTGRTQLTYGDEDDGGPQWSLDGRKIVFVRGDGDVCTVDADGSDLQRVVAFRSGDAASDPSWLPDGRTIAFIHYRNVTEGGPNALWLLDVTTGHVRRFADATTLTASPDGRWLLLSKSDGEYISDRRTGVSRRLPVISEEAAWQGRSVLLGITSSRDDSRVALATLAVTGKVQRGFLCRWPHSDTDPYADSVDPGNRWLESYSEGQYRIVYVQDVGYSGDRPANDYWLADTRTGRMTKITDGQFLVWSPGAKCYCTATPRSLSDYGVTINGYQKGLYTAALRVGSSKTGKERETVSGLVWVTGADWRKRRR